MRRHSPLNILLACVCVSALVLAIPVTASATTASERADLLRYRARKNRNKAAEERDKADELVSQARRIEDRIDQLDGEIAGLEGEIGTVTEHRTRLEAEIESLRASIAEKESQIEEVQADFNAQTDALAGRIDATYRAGDWAYVQLLLDAGDFADLFERTTFVQQIMAKDVEIADELERTRIDLEAVRAELDRDLTSVNAKRSEVLAEENRLRDLAASRDAARDQQAAARSEKENLLAETRKNASRLEAQAEAEEAESRRIEGELSGGASSGGGRYVGGLTWPTPGYNTVGSRFGMRYHPILHYRRLHAGIDIRVPYGARIVAAGTGRVIYAGWRGGYGKCTMIDHGDGLVSLYAHQSSIKVSVGKHVTAGDTIGKVGSTGLSTGPHLHFETRVNGSPRNPMNYL